MLGGGARARGGHVTGGPARASPRSRRGEGGRRPSPAGLFGGEDRGPPRHLVSEGIPAHPFASSVVLGEFIEVSVSAFVKPVE